MKKNDVRKYKIKKGVGQIVFDLALSGGMYLTGIRFDGKGMVAYQVMKGFCYLAWDVLIFDDTVKEDKQEDTKC